MKEVYLLPLSIFNADIFSIPHWVKTVTLVMFVTLHLHFIKLLYSFWDGIQDCKQIAKLKGVLWISAVTIFLKFPKIPSAFRIVAFLLNIKSIDGFQNVWPKKSKSVTIIYVIIQFDKCLKRPWVHENWNHYRMLTPHWRWILAFACTPERPRVGYLHFLNCLLEWW